MTSLYLSRQWRRQEFVAVAPVGTITSKGHDGLDSSTSACPGRAAGGECVMGVALPPAKGARVLPPENLENLLSK